MVMQGFLEAFGWRGAYIGVAALLAFMVLPLIYMFIQDSPADVGLMPDNRQEEKVSASALSLTGLTFRQAMKTRTFWFLFVMTLVFAV